MCIKRQQKTKNVIKLVFVYYYIFSYFNKNIVKVGYLVRVNNVLFFDSELMHGFYQALNKKLNFFAVFCPIQGYQTSADRDALAEN